MKRSHWVLAAASALVMLMIAPIAEADSSGRVDICHLSSDWSLITVSVKSLEQHLEHGDGMPLDDVPGSDGEAVFDESCEVTAQGPGDPGDPGDPPVTETVFAIAYSDMNGNGSYDSGTDVLIAKFIDGPSPYDNGAPGAGDLVLTDRYPLDRGPTGFGDFGVTSHTITGASSTATRCMASSSGGSFIWDGSSSFEGYEERALDGSLTFFRDSLASGSDALVTHSGSPSQPSTPVSGGITSVVDDPFLETELSCSG